MDGKEEILNLLRDNARLSVEDISAMTKKTVAEVQAIIQQLENEGIIMKYAAIVNPEKDINTKEKVRAEIEIQVTPEREHGFDAIADRIYRFPQVKSLYLMSADGYDLKVILEGKSLQEVANFVAKANNCNYLFEASVGGGIPIIRPLINALAQEEILSITGILNGTTNYILTKMKEDGRGFSDVLAEAQSLGYAERDPSADIDGIDAKRKIIILSALASGVLASENEVYAESLRDISGDDMAAAEKLGGEIKYVATANFGEQNEVYVCPMIVKRTNPISSISGVYNGISVTSLLTGDIMYYGRGAGRFPTAGAVLSDVVAVLSGAVKGEKIPVFTRGEGRIKPFDEVSFNVYLRTDCSSEELCGRLETVAEKVEIISDDNGKTEAVVCGVTNAGLKSVLPDARVIRILE